MLPALKTTAWVQPAGVFIFTLCLVSLAGERGLSAQSQPRDKLDAAWIEPHVGQSLPLDARLATHDGRIVQLRELFRQRPVVLCMVYFECPMLCRLAADGVMRAVSSLPEQVGRDFDVLFISFDPRDTPHRAQAARAHALRQYAHSGAEQGLHFLTGPQASIDAVTQAVGFHYAWDDATKQFSHATGLMIVAPDGVITEYLDGVNFSPSSLSSAIGRARRSELTQSQAISFVRCYLYDPTNGKFGAAVQWTIRVLALATVVLIGVAIVRMNRLSRASGNASSGAAPVQDFSAANVSVEVPDA